MPHYLHWYRRNGPCPIGTPAERFAAKTRLGVAGCILWTGARSSRGYGSFAFEGKVVPAHRWAYEQAHGPVPAGLHIDHLCRVPACVNPEHLEPVTPRENVLRSPIAKAALNALKTHCPLGHPYTPENTYAYGNRRWCRICGREKVRRYKAKR